MIKVNKFYCQSFTLDSVSVFWEIEDLSLTDDIYRYSFTLLKSEAQAGPYDVQFGPMQNIFYFSDTTTPQNHKNRNIYYKLIVKDLISNETQEFGPTGQIPEPDLIALEIIRMEDTLFRQFTGRKCIVFPAKTMGSRCTGCYDSSTGRQTRANCIICFGTGWLGGYNSPIACYIQIDPNSKTTQLSPNINHNVNLTSARLSNFPPINPGDIIVENENKRWIVIEMRPSQRLRAVVKQELTIKEILKSDIAYKLPVLINIPKIDDIAEYRNFTNPTTITPDKPNYRNAPVGVIVNS